jgi:hypothetical protein
MEGVTIPPMPAELRQLRTTGGPPGLRRDELAVVELLRKRSRTEPLKLIEAPTSADQPGPRDTRDNAA